MNTNTPTQQTRTTLTPSQQALNDQKFIDLLKRWLTSSKPEIINVFSNGRSTEVCTNIGQTALAALTVLGSMQMDIVRLEVEKKEAEDEVERLRGDVLGLRRELERERQIIGELLDLDMVLGRVGGLHM